MGSEMCIRDRFSIIASITNLSESIHLKKIGGKSIFFLILNTAIASTITVIVAVILNVGDGFAYKVANGYQKVEVPSVVDTIVNLFPSNFATNWSEGQIIPIVVFAIIIALSYNAISKDNESVKPFKAFIDAGNQVIGQAIDWIIGFTPYAVLSFLARAVGRSSVAELLPLLSTLVLSLIHISEPTRRTPISYAVFCLKKKTTKSQSNASAFYLV